MGGLREPFSDGAVFGADRPNCIPAAGFPAPTPGRGGLGATATLPTPAGVIHLDLEGFRVFANRQLVALTRLEFDLLTYLVIAAPRVVPQEELFANIIRSAHDPGSSLLRVHFTHLRRKLGPLGSALETVRGRGYRLASLSEQLATP